MGNNILETVQQLVQDVIAPDVRKLKVRIGVLEKQIETLEKHMDYRFNLTDQKNDAQFRALLAAIAESKAQSELSNTRFLAALSERVAVLEAERH